MGKRQLQKNGTPLYYQIRDYIMDEYGDSTNFLSLPSERELCEMFGVSRSTVRKGMGLLESEGKILRMRGKGSFFNGNTSNTRYRVLSGIGFYNDELRQGKITKSKVLLQNVEHASAEISEKLEISEEEDIFHLLRLRFIDGKVVALTESYIPMYIFPEIIKIDFTDKSLYNIFRENGIEPNAEYQALEVRPANAYQAMHLEIEKGDPLLIAFTLTHDDDGRIIEYVTTTVAAYKTRFEFNNK